MKKFLKSIWKSLGVFDLAVAWCFPNEFGSISREENQRREADPNLNRFYDDLLQKLREEKKVFNNS